MVTEQWIGYTLGKYTIHKFLGKKRSSTLYLATDNYSQETVLIKIIHPSILQEYGPGFLDMLYQSVRISIDIRHPNLPRIYDTGRVAEYFYVAMEYFSGSTMEQILMECQALSVNQALYVIREVCKGLQAGHAKGILHFDIKPRNILWTEAEEVKLLEFGLALPMENTGMFGAEKVLLGTPSYVAPEQIQGNVELDERSDLYSLGATLFHLLVGQPPYQGSNSEILQKHLYAPVPSIRIYNPELPETLDQFVVHLMQKDPAQRIADTVQLEKVLNHILSQTPKTKRIPKSEVPPALEEFLLTKILRSEEDRSFIQNTLQAIANSQKKGNIPDEVQTLMDQIIIEEFITRFGSPETREMMEKVKQCPTILQNPKAWIDAKIAESKDKNPKSSITKKFPNINPEMTKTAKLRNLPQMQRSGLPGPEKKEEAVPQTPSSHALHASRVYNYESPSKVPPLQQGNPPSSDRNQDWGYKTGHGKTQEHHFPADIQEKTAKRGSPYEEGASALKATKPTTSHGRIQDSMSYESQEKKSSHGTLPPPILGSKAPKPPTFHGRVVETPTSYSDTTQERPKSSHGKNPPLPAFAQAASAGLGPESLSRSTLSMPGEQPKSSHPPLANTGQEIDGGASRIIKASQRSTEALLIPPEQFGSSTISKSKNQNPLEYIQQAMAEEQKKKALKKRQEEKKNEHVLARKFFIYLLLLACLVLILWQIYNLPEVKEWVGNFVRQQLIQFNIISPSQDKKEEKKYPNITPQVLQMCGQKKFSEAYRLVKRTELAPATSLELLEKIAQEEKKFLQTLPPGVGWFGEKLMVGMSKAATAGEYFWEKDQSVMVFVSAGSFIRGSNNPDHKAFPEKRIYLSAYYIDKYEVTNKQYSQFVIAVGYKMPVYVNAAGLEGDDNPVVGITYEDARKYAQWVDKRLPTEAEWEKACRGGDTIPDWQKGGERITLMPNPWPHRTYPWGEAAPSPVLANYKQLSSPFDPYEKTSPVGAFPQGCSPYLCEDMMGNAREWCYDQYDANYYSGPEVKNPRGPTPILGGDRVLRGGDWDSTPYALFSYQRSAYRSEISYNTVGFRLAKESNPE